MTRTAIVLRICWLTFAASLMGLVVGGFLGAALFLAIDIQFLASLEEPCFQRFTPFLWTAFACAGTGAYFAGRPTWRHFREQLKQR